MHLLIVGHVLHKQVGDKIFAYGPYTREMNLWFKHVDRVTILAPLEVVNEVDPIDLELVNTKIEMRPVKEFQTLSSKDKLMTLLKLPRIFWEVGKAMREADHIHLRCPGNMGLIGALVQLLFPKTPKSAKYAGNWDRKSIQPVSYRMQQNILSKTDWTKNMKVLVYGDWPEESENIHSFFTASYSAKEIDATSPRKLQKSERVKLLFAGALALGKQPIISAKVCKELIHRGIECQLDFFGVGPLRGQLERYILDQGLENNITLHGNVNAEQLKAAYKESHFLIFISQSEGWPKVVAEAMFWACLPVTTRVSCVPQMLDFGKRGELVNADVQEIVGRIQIHLHEKELYHSKASEAQKWSQEYTIEKFEKEIQLVLNPN